MKIGNLREAIKEIRSGKSVFLGGSTANSPFAAAHEIIRQRKRNLTLIKTVGGVLLDQLIGAGCAKRVITSWIGNYAGPSPGYAFRRAVEEGIPFRVEVEEYSALGLALSYFAGALQLPFIPIKSWHDSDSFHGTSFLKGKKGSKTKCPFTNKDIPVVSPIHPDIGIIQAQRATEDGDVQVWGATFDLKYGLLASKKIIVCAEEIVEKEEIRKNPDRTILPSFMVDFIVEESFGSHPAEIMGYYDRDMEFYNYYSQLKTLEEFRRFVDEWIYGVESRRDYLKKLGKKRLEKLRKSWKKL